MPDSTWSEGVIARHLTKAAEILGEDITVDVIEGEADARAICRGCGSTAENEPEYASVTVWPWAVRHAAECRAMPRPTEA